MVIHCILRSPWAQHCSTPCALFSTIQCHVTARTDGSHKLGGGQDQVVIATVLVVHANSQNTLDHWFPWVTVSELMLHHLLFKEVVRGVMIPMCQADKHCVTIQCWVMPILSLKDKKYDNKDLYHSQNHLKFVSMALPYSSCHVMALYKE